MRIDKKTTDKAILPPLLKEWNFNENEQEVKPFYSFEIFTYISIIEGVCVVMCFV